MNKRVLILATGESGDDQITPLQSPVPDGERLRDLLAREDVGGYDVRLVPNPSLVIARMEIEDFFGQAKADDTLILLITGHGMRDDGMRLFFATADSRHNRVRSTSLAARFVLEERDRSLAARKILMFDTCHAGSYAKGHVNKSAETGFLPDDFDTAIEGTAVLTASSARQSAREAEVDGVYQSHFTRLLIEGIQTGAADPEGTGEITLDQLFAYLRTGLRRDSPGQTPSIEMKGALGSFKIANNPAWQKPQLSAELQEAVASTNRVSRRGAVNELVELVSTGAREADSAKEALLSLLRDSDTTVSQAVVQSCKLHGLDIAGLYENTTANPRRTIPEQAKFVGQQTSVDTNHRGADDIVKASEDILRSIVVNQSQTTTSDKWRNGAKLTLALCILINFVSAANLSMMPFLLMGDARGELAQFPGYGLHFAGLLSGSMISIRVADVIGSRILIAFALCALIVLNGMMTIFSGAVGDFFWLQNFLIGALDGVLLIFATISAVQKVPERQIPFTVGLVWAGAPAGSMVAGFLFNGVSYDDTRFFISGAVAFLTVILALVVLLKFPRRGAPPDVKITMHDALAGGRLRSSILLWVAIICISFVTHSVFHVVSKLSSDGVTDAYTFSIAYGIGAFLGALAIAFASRTIDNRKIGITINFSAALVFFFFVAMLPEAAATIAGLATGLTLVAGMNILFVIVVETYPEKARLKGLGWAVAVSAIGSFLGSSFGMSLQYRLVLEPPFLLTAFCVPLFIAALALVATKPKVGETRDLEPETRN